MNKEELVDLFASTAMAVWEKELGHPLILQSVESVSYTSTIEGLTATVQVEGELEGIVLFELSKKAGRDIIAATLGQQVDDMDELASSFLGELASIISIRVTSELTVDGYRCACDQPIVIQVAGVHLPILSGSQVRINLRSDLCNFRIRISLSESAEQLDHVSWLHSRLR